MALKPAEQFCREHKHRFTDPRRLVLEIVSGADKPMTAYDILEALREHLNNPKPPTAYRALEFWQRHGFLHRIESLNAYVTCHAGHRHDGAQYLICEGCGDVQEIHLCSLPDALAQKAISHNFQHKYWNTEVHGLCGSCSN